MPELLDDQSVQPWQGRHPEDVVPEVFRPVMFCAWSPLDVLTYPWQGRIALSGDPAYAEANRAAISTLRDHFDCVISWADDPTLALALVRELGLDGWCGQAESEEQALLCLDAGATEIIGNASAITENTRRLIRESGAMFLQECYSGDSQPAPSKVSCVDISGCKLVPGIYSACWSQDEYLADMPALAEPGGPLGGLYLAEGGDWSKFCPASGGTTG